MYIVITVTLRLHLQAFSTFSVEGTIAFTLTTKTLSWRESLAFTRLKKPRLLLFKGALALNPRTKPDPPCAWSLKNSAAFGAGIKFHLTMVVLTGVKITRQTWLSSIFCKNKTKIDSDVILLFSFSQQNSNSYNARYTSEANLCVAGDRKQYYFRSPSTS